MCDSMPKILIAYLVLISLKSASVLLKVFVMLLNNLIESVRWSLTSQKQVFNQGVSPYTKATIQTIVNRFNNCISLLILDMEIEEKLKADLTPREDQHGNLPPVHKWW